MYAKVKNNAFELHKFIVTRTHVRTLKQLFKTDNERGYFLEKDPKKYPITPDYFDPQYCDSMDQTLDMYNLMLYQGVEVRTQNNGKGK